MRKLWGWAALLGLALLLAVLMHGLGRETPRPAADSAASLGLMLLEKEHGLYVLAVTQDTPADRTGVRPGDIILGAGDEQAAGLAWLEGLLAAGAEQLPLTISRDSRKITLLLPVK